MLKNFTRGGQTFLHNVHMFLQIAHKVIFVFILSVIISYGIIFFTLLKPKQDTLFLNYVTDKVISSLDEKIRPLGFSSVEEMLSIGKHSQKYSATMRIKILEAQGIHRALEAHILKSLWLSLTASLLLSIAVTFFLIRFGKKSTENIFVRGGKLVTPNILKRMLKEEDAESEFVLGKDKIPLSKGSEAQHTMIIGSPGSGKTVALREILAQCREKKQKAVVYDKKGSFVSQFYREGKDIILNPFDARFPGWSLWEEAQESPDFDAMASALIPAAKGDQDPFWVLAARTIFSVAANRMKTNDNITHKDLLQFLLTVELNDMLDLLKGTEAGPLASEKADKIALSVRSILAANIRGLKYVDPKPNIPPFSIREWVKEEDNDSWIFITSRQPHHETLKPIITMWIDTASMAMLDLPLNIDRRIHLTLDEIPTLQNVPALPGVLATGREYGVCAWLTIQSLPQMHKNFGENTANEIMDLCATGLYFRNNFRTTTTAISESLGEHEIEETRENISYGAESMRDGISLSKDKHHRKIVLPSEIRNLPDLNAYLKLPGDWPITKIEFNYKSYEKVSPDFLPGKIVDSISDDKKTTPQKSTQQSKQIPIPQKQSKKTKEPDKDFHF